VSLSDQIKQPGQIVGAGGGGGGSNDAGDLTTGTLAAARLPGVLANVDTQAELLSAAAAAAASHTHAIADLPLKHIFQMTRITSATSGLSGSYADNNLVFNEETTDEGSDFTVSSGVATCQTAARYLLILARAIDQSQGIIYWIVKNSTKICEAYTGIYQSCNMSIVTSLAVNDTVKVVVAGASGPVVQPGAKLLAIKIGKGS